MKLLKKILIFTLPLLLAISQSYIVKAAAEPNNEINIETIPDSYLFKISNLKPGDFAKKKLTIQNLGNRDFMYTNQAKFKGGSKELYGEFKLKVSDAEKVLHDGKLKDYKGLTPRYLESMNQEDLLFEVEFPYELGNEFQGLGFEVEFKFIVEGYDPPPPGGGSEDDPDNPKNPDTPSELTESNGPEFPGNSDNPIVSKDPGNPDKPTKSFEPQNPDKINPQYPIDPEKLNSPIVDGQILPSTATNIFNLVFAGFALVVVGGILFFFQRKRTMVIKK